ncbi:MAG: hypothetical protein U0Q12_02870 [Vicinamibacterales bacterium]
MLNLLDVPDALAGDTNGLYANYPDTSFHYGDREVAYTKRVKNFFVQTSFDHQ